MRPPRGSRHFVAAIAIPVPNRTLARPDVLAACDGSQFPGLIGCRPPALLRAHVGGFHEFLEVLCLLLFRNLRGGAKATS